MSSSKEERSRGLLSSSIVVVLSLTVIGVGLLVIHQDGSNQTGKPENSATDEFWTLDRDTEESTLSAELRAVGEVRNLEDLDAFNSEFLWTLALHVLVAQSDEDRLVHLARRSEGIQSRGRQDEAQQVIFQRLASVNPRAALRKIDEFAQHRRRFLTTAVFREWSSTDLDEAVDHARDLSGPAKLAAMRGILRSHDDMSDDLKRNLISQLDLQQYAYDFLQQADVSNIAGDPESAWSTLLNDDIDNVAQTGAFIQVAESWVDESGFSALRRINDSINQSDDFHGRYQTHIAILIAAVHRLAASDPESAFSESLDLEDDPGDVVSKMLVEIWARDDPQAALRAVLALNPDHVMRGLMESTVVQTWANADPTNVLAKLGTVPEDKRPLAKLWAFSAIANHSPEQAASMFTSMEHSAGENDTDIAMVIATSWARDDAGAATDWVLGTPGLEDVRSDLLRYVLPQLVAEDPHRAMETARKQPVRIKDAGLEATVIAELAKVDVDQAIAMLSQARDDRTKLSAFKSIGATLVRNKNTEQALKLALRLSGQERNIYYDRIFRSWSHSHPEDLLDSLDQLPSDHIRSGAALLLLVDQNPFRMPLKDKQIERAESFLNERHARSLEAFRQSQPSPEMQ